MSLREYHGFGEGIRWRIVPAGVEIEGCGVERTPGRATAAAHVWETYGHAINEVSRAYRIPCHLIVATICTESMGRSDAIRLEPGYVSDEATPRKISAGLMQTLLSTARAAIRMSVGRDWLLVARNSIEAGTAYIAELARVTALDAPLVAASYNAGGLYYQPGAQNRWKLRQYPIGTGKHVDRFVRFFNDAAYVLANHPIIPSVGLDVLGATGMTAAPTAKPAPTASGNEAVSPSRTQHSSTASTNPAIAFAPTARPDDVTPYSRAVLSDLLRSCGIDRVVVSSTCRDPETQARVMYDNIERFGVDAQKHLYARPGRAVIEVYERRKHAGKSAGDIKAAMALKIRELGPTKVSRHAADPKILNVFDVAPSSIRDKRNFEEAVKSESRVSKFLTPPIDPGYHFEIPQPKA
jgi:hypothetical protein